MGEEEKRRMLLLGKGICLCKCQKSREHCAFQDLQEVVLIEWLGSKPPYVMNSHIKDFKLHLEDNGEPLKGLKQEYGTIKFLFLKDLSDSV